MSLCIIVWQVVILTCLSSLSGASQKEEKNGDPTILKGHLQPFGESGQRREIEVRNDFPEPYDFLKNYLKKSKPVKLPGVMRDSRAVRLWTDAYLMSLDVPADTVVGLETKKKENRSQETTSMHFHEFLKIYNQTEHYMVDDVPKYLRPDVMVPCSLQCPELVEQGFAFAMMWFSSGGTNSVVHTDAFDNLNCLLRGQKSFVMMDPARDRDKIDISHNGAYSAVDVDSVDLTKFPGLADAEFYHVNVTAGDCLYIPYRWIHQVRSFNSNVAVNFWWDHYSSSDLLDRDEAVCQGQCDRSLTLDKVELNGQDSSMDNLGSLKDWMRDVVINNPMTIEMVKDMFRDEYAGGELPEIADKLLNEVFEKLDLNKDGQYTIDDNEEIPDENWETIRDDVSALTSMLEEDNLKFEREEYAQYVEADRKREEL
ncbi:hypothetical protein V1264_015897 [Littorina saxatilis]